MRIDYQFDESDNTWVACLKKGAFRKMSDGSFAQPIARVASGLTKGEARRNLQLSRKELLAKADGGECKHHHYETKTHPELGEQPFCPNCDEFIEL